MAKQLSFSSGLFKLHPPSSESELRAKQIPLFFGHFERFDFASYLPDQNAQIVACLERLVAGDESKNLYLWGAAGSGKSHLLQAVCTSLSALGKRPAYVPLAELDAFSPAMLEGLEQLDLICMDALDCIAGRADWELAVFNLFNRLREAQRPLIMAAHSSPHGLAISLPDLKSRLAWDVVYHLSPLTEAQCLEVLQQRAGLRGLELSNDVSAYLLKRIARDMHSLLDWLNRLDDASLAAKKKLTVPLVKQLLNER